jgi:hypothetical protein
MTVLGVGGGIRFNPPTPDEVMHVSAPFFLRGLKWRGSKDERASINCTWAMVTCNALTALGGRGYLVGPPPIDWVVLARYHLPKRINIQ